MYQRENEKTNNLQTALTPDENGFNLSILEEMDDPDYTSEIVTLFLNDTPRQLKEIREALTTNAYETVYKTAHKLKSSAGILQADRLIKFLADLETKAKESKANDQLAALLKIAEQEFNSIAQRLKGYVK